MKPSALLLICGFLPGVHGAGGVSIFMIGQEIDLRPWEVFAMYFMVIIVSVFYELLTHHIDHMVTSNSGKAIVSHIYKEVMILGGISLLLTIMENSGGDLLFEAVFFHYVHFVIFFMAINLIVSISVLFLFINKSWYQWSFFEHVLSEVENDPRADLSTRTALLAQYVKRCPEGSRMLSCLLFFRSNVPMHFKKISFTRYMKKQQRKELLSFLDLHASAWGALAVLVFFVAVQTFLAEKIVGPDTDDAVLSLSSSSSSGQAQSPVDPATNSSVVCDCSSSSSSSGSPVYGQTFDLVSMGLFIAIEGYGTLAVIIMCYLKVRYSYNRFADNIEAMRKEKKLKPIVPQNYYFWKGDPKHLMTLLQVMLLYQVFYLATITTNLAPRLWGIKGGFLILIFSVLPTVLVFVVLIPGLMPKYTILKSVGDLLDLETLHDIQLSDEASGRYRRLAIRQAEASGLPPFIQEALRPLDDEVQQLIRLDRARKNPLKKPERYQELGGGASDDDSQDDGNASYDGLSPKASPHKNKRKRRHPEIFCEECEKQPAVRACGVCGMLCNTCDVDYHKLKKNSAHLVIELKSRPNAKLNELQTDTPLYKAQAERNHTVVAIPNSKESGLTAL
eukprot:TRINITY_DN12034_c0_g1_i1.p1 TRINITY_DN12034_c0_g1~~TRINITY_DN12034_c0_g1_i1.p1  ORF type:complete len:617 (+),score=53.16 TRINITY_DN12034_c0_g1_i1:91-1941(+)